MNYISVCPSVLQWQFKMLYWTWINLIIRGCSLLFFMVSLIFIPPLTHNSFLFQNNGLLRNFVKLQCRSMNGTMQLGQVSWRILNWVFPQILIFKQFIWLKFELRMENLNLNFFFMKPDPNHFWLNWHTNFIFRAKIRNTNHLVL